MIQDHLHVFGFRFSDLLSDRHGDFGVKPSEALLISFRLFTSGPNVIRDQSRETPRSECFLEAFSFQKAPAKKMDIGP